MKYLVMMVMVMMVSCASFNIKTKQGVTVETDKGSFTCIFDIEKGKETDVKTTCSGKIILGEKSYYECKNISVDALLKKEIDIASDCELVIL